jgi:hypothetical protein
VTTKNAVYEILRNAAVVRTDVSEENIDSIIKVPKIREPGKR